MHNEVFPRTAERQEVVRNELVNRIALAGEVRVGCKRVCLLALLYKGSLYLFPVLYYAVHELRLWYAPLRNVDAVGLGEHGETEETVLGAGTYFAAGRVTRVDRAFLNMVFLVILVDVRNNRIGPAGKLEHAREYPEVLRLRDKVGQRRVTHVYYTVEAVHDTVRHFLVARYDMRLAVDDDNSSAAYGVSAEIYLYVTVVHVGIAERADGELRGKVSRCLAVVDNRVTHDVFRYGVGSKRNVEVGSVVYRVEIRLDSVVGRCEHGVVAAGRKQFRDGGLGFAAQTDTRAQVSELLKPLGLGAIGISAFALEDIQVAVVYLVATSCERQGSHKNNKKPVKIFLLCLFHDIFIFQLLFLTLSQNLAEAAKQRLLFLFLPASRAENLCLNRQRRTKLYRKCKIEVVFIKVFLFFYTKIEHLLYCAKILQ